MWWRHSSKIELAQYVANQMANVLKNETIEDHFKNAKEAIAQLNKYSKEGAVLDPKDIESQIKRFNLNIGYISYLSDLLNAENLEDIEDIKTPNELNLYCERAATTNLSQKVWGDLAEKSKAGSQDVPECYIKLRNKDKVVTDNTIFKMSKILTISFKKSFISLFENEEYADQCEILNSEFNRLKDILKNKKKSTNATTNEVRDVAPPPSSAVTQEQKIKSETVTPPTPSTENTSFVEKMKQKLNSASDRKKDPMPKSQANRPQPSSKFNLILNQFEGTVGTNLNDTDLKHIGENPRARRLAIIDKQDNTPGSSRKTP